MSYEEERIENPTPKAALGAEGQGTSAAPEPETPAEQRRRIFQGAGDALTAKGGVVRYPKGGQS